MHMMRDAPAAPAPLQEASFFQRARERARKRVLLTFKRALRPFAMRHLRQRNMRSTESVLSARGPVVSLTTHGARLQRVFYTVESIARGKLKPSRLVLWIDHALLDAGLPASLQRLVARGLEVRGTQDLGPHTKYFPQIMSEPAPSRPLVTADDDVIYPDYWLQMLVDGWRQHPSAITCFRAYRFGLRPDGQLSPYARWSGCESVLPSPLHFLTGVAGVLYPVDMQLALRSAADAFKTRCPRADDIWLNVVALRAGVPVRQITPVRRSFYEVPGTRAHGLALGNVCGGENDRQITATYTPADLARLLEVIAG